MAILMSGSILIVDSNAADASENARILSDLGFRVATATTFDEANRELARMSDLVMVLADVRLGEYNGLHLAMRVRRAYPQHSHHHHRPDERHRAPPRDGAT